MTCLPRIVALAIALPPAGASAQAPITRGADAPDDVAVVGLTYGGALRCTGTLVAPLVVLTAAHCVAAQRPTGVIFVDRSGGRTEVLIGRTEHHAAFEADTLAADIGAVVLAAPAPTGVAPVALSPGVSAAVDDELRLVGFGRTGALARDEGARREGVAVVDAIDAVTLRLRPAPSQPCIGDSGGPAFATIGGVEHLVGVTSHGDSVCMSFGVETRVDAYLDDFVQPLIDDLGECQAGACTTEESGCAAAGARRPSAAWLLLAAAIVGGALRRRSGRAIDRCQAVRR
jgi:hypothetical protein